jgi:hypothetical protein
MDEINGMATYAGAARLLAVTYWQVVQFVKKHKVPTVKLTGSNAVLVKLSDLAELQKEK